MRLNLLGKINRLYLQGATLAIIAAVAAGCSSGTQRFTDSFYTSATPNQYEAMNGQGNYQQPVAQQNNIQSSNLPPVQSQPNNQINQAQTSQANQQVASASQALASQPQNLGTIPVTANSNTVAARQGTPSNSRYIVQSGDTLYAISRKTGASVDAIKKANNLSNGGVRVGQALTIPHGGNVTQNTVPQEPKVITASASQATTNLKPAEPIANSKNPSEPQQSPASQQTNHPDNAVATSTDKLTKATDAAVIAPQSTGITKMRWPVRGRILSNFGEKEGVKTNEGIDIMAPEGTSVRAAENGVVTYVGDAVKGLGNTILIKHDNNMLTIYGNNSKILVQRGQQVHRGDEIAKSGMSGGAASPRLHFEVRKNQMAVNPIKYLEN